MSKVLITADIHFGVPGRLQDILFSCKVMREYCYQNNIDTILVLGDMFHDRKSLEIETLYEVCTFFEETVSNYKQNWITFPGNHDMFLRHSWNIHSLKPLDKLITVIDTVKILKLDDKRFWILPFVQYEKAYMKIIDKISKKFEPGDNLLTHIGIRGATLNTCFLLKDWSIVDFEDYPFNRVYTGHFHSKQQIGMNVWYPGSPIPFKFDEGDVPHGFYIYDTEEDNHKFINIWKAAAKYFPETTPPPQFMTVLDSDIINLDYSDVQNNIIRIALQRDFTNEEKRKIKAELEDKGATAVRWMNIKEKIEKSKEVQEHSNKNHKNLFAQWVSNDNKGIKDLDVPLLHQMHNEVIQEGDELYSAEESDNW